MARELGFENINMALIAGLPGETLDDMKDTLRQIEMVAPDSLTVHALAMKRASRPVSYTHLDVYKRQSAEIEMHKNSIKQGEKVVIIDDLIDVYKRQSE